jgi:hypothetical protein
MNRSLESYQSIPEALEYRLSDYNIITRGGVNLRNGNVSECPHFKYVNGKFSWYVTQFKFTVDEFIGINQ